MKFSLILVTKNRVKEVKRFLQSLSEQTFHDFELMIVDRNSDDRLAEFVNNYSQKFPILHLKQPQPGLSRARNRGRLQIQGELVAFPDDDCLYPPELLANVVSFLDKKKTWDGVIARVYDLEADRNAFLYCGDDRSGEVDLERAFQIGITHAMFFRASLVKDIPFDETLGPETNTPWGCGEDTDYLIRCVQAGYKIYYNPELIVRHPNPYDIYNFRQLVRREYSYARGNGYLMGNYFPPAFVRKEIFQNIPYIFSTFFKGQFSYCVYVMAIVLGLSLGYWDSWTQKPQMKPSTLR